MQKTPTKKPNLPRFSSSISSENTQDSADKYDEELHQSTPVHEHLFSRENLLQTAFKQSSPQNSHDIEYLENLIQTAIEIQQKSPAETPMKLQKNFDRETRNAYEDEIFELKESNSRLETELKKSRKELNLTLEKYQNIISSMEVPIDCHSSTPSRRRSSSSASCRTPSLFSFQERDEIAYESLLSRDENEVQGLKAEIEDLTQTCARLSDEKQEVESKLLEISQKYANLETAHENLNAEHQNFIESSHKNHHGFDNLLNYDAQPTLFDEINSPTGIMNDSILSNAHEIFNDIIVTDKDEYMLLLEKEVKNLRKQLKDAWVKWDNEHRVKESFKSKLMETIHRAGSDDVEDDTMHEELLQNLADCFPGTNEADSHVDMTEFYVEYKQQVDTFMEYANELLNDYYLQKQKYKKKSSNLSKENKELNDRLAESLVHTNSVQEKLANLLSRLKIISGIGAVSQILEEFDVTDNISAPKIQVDEKQIQTDDLIAKVQDIQVGTDEMQGTSSLTPFKSIESSLDAVDLLRMLSTPKSPNSPLIRRRSPKSPRKSKTAIMAKSKKTQRGKISNLFQFFLISVLSISLLLSILVTFKRSLTVSNSLLLLELPWWLRGFESDLVDTYDANGQEFAFPM